MADGKVPERIRKQVFREDGLICAVCGLTGFEVPRPSGGVGYYTPIEGVYMSIDHIIPMAKGGTNNRKNLRVLCTTCNTIKGTKIEDGRKRAGNA